MGIFDKISDGFEDAGDKLSKPFKYTYLHSLQNNQINSKDSGGKDLFSQQTEIRNIPKY